MRLPRQVRRWSLAALGGLFLGFPWSGVAATGSVPNFKLPKWRTNEKVGLSDFTGEVVVLDFFAYWCVPCRLASEQFENGIQKYYAGKKGNPHGVPVRVLSINIEQDHPELTEQFIKETGLELVLNDVEGSLLEKLGGAGTPFLVIVDLSSATKEASEFGALYQNAGFAGTQTLRGVIDAVRPPQSVPAGATARALELEKVSGPPTTRQGAVAFDAMLASDVQITSTTARYGQRRGGTEWKVSYTHNSYGLDYEPFRAFDFLGYSERRREVYHGGQVSLRQTLSKRLTLLGSGGAYHGFTDYRSLWLANYYRQQFDFVPGYEPADPQGFNTAAGLRWEYQPTTGFVEAGFAYGNDQIAPGYELDSGSFELLRSREILHTYSPTLKFENVLTPRIRTLNEWQLTVTSGREPRYSYRGSVNIALGEPWVWRSSGGYTHEDPTLRAWFVGSTLELEVAPRWLVSLSGLSYEDTGEIENSLFISTAAPGLRTYQFGLGLRYVAKQSSLSLSVARLRSEYDPVAVGTRPFTNLYQARTWVVVQAAWAIEF